MAGKVLIGGTAYTIAGGKACVGGTAYSISGGKTLVGGTAYSIAFKKYTLDDLLKRITLISTAGRDSGSTGLVQIAIPPNGTYYLFAYYYGRVSIYRLAANGASSVLTTLKQSQTTYCTIFVDNPNLILRTSGTTTSTMGATMGIVQFRGYTEAEADTILSACIVETALSNGVGVSNKGGTTCSIAQTTVNGKILTAANNTNISFVYIADGSTTPQVLFGTNTANPSLLRYDSGAIYISTDGTTNTSVHGATIRTMN